MTYYPEFADKLNTYLQHQDRTASWLAHQLEIHPGTVGRWLNQGTRPGSPEVIVRLADLLGVHAVEERQALLIAAGYGYQEKAEPQAHLVEERQVEDSLTKPDNVPDASASKHNLPVSLTPLIGRAAELARLNQLLANPDLRLINVVGPGGVGKTRLALEAASTQVPHFQDGVYLISLAPLQAAETMIAAIAEAIGFTFYDQSPPKQQLWQYLAKKQLLLLLDNFEHLLAEANLLIALLQAAPALKILTTSRIPLQLEGEQLYPLDGLTYPTEADQTAPLATLNSAQHGALVLFTSNTRRVAPDFRLTDSNLGTVSRICQLVAGMPLGLILASTWLKMLTIDEIAAEIERNFAFLQADLQSLPPRQRSLQAVFNHSWKLLNQRGQTILAQLSIFRGGFDHQAAQAVTGAELADLLALVEQSLLYRTSTGRYELHELLRQFAAQKLEATPAQAHAARTRHSAYYLSFLAQREVDLKGAQQQTAMAEIEADGENIANAWRWGLENEEIDLLTAALDSLALFYLWRSRFHEGKTMCQLVVTKLANLAVSPARARLQARVLIQSSTFQRHLKKFESAHQSLQQAQALLESPPLVALDTRLEQAQLLLEQAEINKSSNYDQAKDFAEQSLELYRTLDDPWRIAQVLTLLGNILYIVGQLVRAREVVEEGLALRQHLGDARGLARSFENLGHIAREEMNFEQAETYLRQSIAIAQQLQDRYQQSQAIHFLAGTLSFSGRFSASFPFYEESRRIQEELNLPAEPSAWSLMVNMALIHVGRYTEARINLEQHMQEPYVNFDKEHHNTATVYQLGRIALAERNDDLAQHYLEQSIILYRSRHYLKLLGSNLSYLGYLALRHNDLHQAQAYIYESLQLALETRIFVACLSALVGVALLRLEQGDVAAAVELYAVASQQGFVGNSQWFQDVAGRYIAAAAESLPPQVVEAAWERGQARDLWETAAELLAEFENVQH